MRSKSVGSRKYIRIVNQVAILDIIYNAQELYYPDVALLPCCLEYMMRSESVGSRK